MNKLRHQILAGEIPERRSLLGTKRTKGANADAGLTSVAISREESRKTHMRDGDRHRLHAEHQVHVKHKRKSYTVQLVNLSGGGAMIAGELEPNLWDKVELHLGDGKIECAVRWLKGGRIGLEFAHETRLDCSEEARSKLLQAVIDQNFSELEIGRPERRADDKPAEQHADNENTSDNQRDGRRHPLIWSGVLHYDFATTPVRLRDISESGALIECEAAIPVGAQPLLDLGDAGSIFGTITWAIGDHMGLKFHEPFDMQQLANSRPEVTPPQWEAPEYLKATSATQSPWNEKWERLSVDELRDHLDGFMKH